MKRFIIQVLKFICPLVVLLILPSYILWKSKENFTLLDKIAIDKSKYIVGYGYASNESNYNYLKWTYLNLNEKKQVWTLGSSRVLEFRREMFDSSFYNVGFMIQGINQFRPFLKSIPTNKYPKYLIIGLDHWWFNSSWDNLSQAPSENYWKNSANFLPKPSTITSVYEDFFSKKITFNLLKGNGHPLSIGLNALINNTGYRNDGSMYYGEQIAGLINHSKTVEDYEYSDTFERIKKGNLRFNYGTSVNEKALIELAELLKYCKRYKIEVIAIIPPFADKVYDKMTQSNKYRYLTEIYTKAKPLFDHYNYEIYDFSKVSLCGSKDNETIDGFHGGEVTYQKIMIKMLDAGSVLNSCVNVKRLKLDITKKKNNYQVYDY